MRTLILLATLVMLGAGCAPRTPEPVIDDTPNANPENCTMSGGRVVDGFCECTAGYLPDPADFCLDENGLPGGDMAPDAEPEPEAS